MSLESNDEDFFEDDILAPKPKKKVDGKRKGNRVELLLVKVLTKRFGEGFSRSVGSGNRWSQASLPKHARDVFSGDLVVSKPNFAFCLESKGGYPDIDLNNIFLRGNATLNGFLKQASKDASRCGRKPMLLWKQDRKPWLAFLETEELATTEFKYRLIYGDWSCVALEELLKLEDEFFFDEA